MYSLVWPKRVLLDANTLLNAALNPSGVARLCVRILKQRKIPIYTSPRVDSEIAKITRIKAGRGLTGVDPWNDVQSFVQANDILSAQIGGALVVPRLNNADQLIGRSAVALDATLITDDLEFLAAMRRADHSALQPWIIVRSHDGSVSDMAKIARFLDWQSTGGFVFARVSPTHWAGGQSTDHFTVFEAEKQAFLHFENASQQWVFQLFGLPAVALPHPINRAVEQLVVGWFKCDGTTTTVVLCAHSEEADEQMFVRKSFPGKATVQLRPAVALGHRLDGSAQWNSHIREFVHGPHHKKHSTFKVFREFSDMSPNPADDGRLDEVLSNLERIAIRF